MLRLSRRFLLLTACGAIALALLSKPGFAQQQDNDALRDLITGLGVVHNIAYPPSMLPEPITSLIAGTVTYTTNFGLKYIPPVLIAPGTVGALPNSADGCSFDFTINGGVEKTRQDFLGVLQSYDDSFVWNNFLGTPGVFHVNTDVRVGLYQGNTLLGNDVSIPMGNQSLRWRGETLITPILDYPPWYIVFAKPVEVASRKLAALAKTPPARRAVLRVMIELLISLGLEGAQAGIDWAGLDGQPTLAGGRPIRNEQFQTVRIFDTVAPTATLNQNVFRIEATQVGGELLRDHIGRLRDSLVVSDNCERIPFVSYAAPSFLPVGETTDVTWTIRDAGPIDINGGANVVQRLQQVIVEDTMPPIILPPPGRVLESGVAVNAMLGRAAVFDLADVRPVIVNDAPATFAADSRTRVTWSATDASGNSSSRSQWVTVKTPGTNTLPEAFSASVNARSFEPIEIELGGEDQDLLDGRYDQLSFSISQPPSNGFFVAPLFPYFIEDYRVENAFGLTKADLSQFLDQQCGADPGNYVPPRDFVTDPRYIAVTDNGTAYVSDNYFICNQVDGRIERRSRIASFTKDADGVLQYVGQTFTLSGDQPRSLFIDGDESVYYISPVSGSSIGRVRRCDNTLQICETFDLDTDQAGQPATDHIQDDPTSIVADGSDVLYAVDGQQSIIAYDLQNVNGNGQPVRLGAITKPGDMELGSLQRKDMAIDSEGNLYVSDIDADRVYKFSTSTVTRNADGSVDFEAGSLVGWMGRCAQNLTTTRACDEIAERSYGYSCTTALCNSAVTAGSQPGQFDSPRGIAVDANGVLYVTDYNNFRVQRFTADGFFAGEAISECDGTCFVLGDFGNPEDVTVNRQFFYVLDRERDLLHVFETTPISAFDDEALTPAQSATVVYQSNDNFTGSDEFRFPVGDGLATSAEASIDVSITRNFRPPVGTEGLVFYATEDQSLDLVVDGFDPDADDLNNLSYRITRTPEHGALNGVGPDFTYEPDANYFGADSFAFTVSDGQMNSEPVDAVIEVAAVNDLPVLTISPMADRFGTGFPIKLEVVLEDIDIDDRHVYGLDWGPGELFRTGRALLPGQTAAAQEPTFIQAAGGTAILLHGVTYFSPGQKTVRICVSDQPGVTALTSCDDPRVTAVTSKMLSIEPMVSKSVVITDSLPVTVSELGVGFTDPVVDGEAFDVTLALYNLEPDDTFTILDATEVTLTAMLGDGLEFVGAPVMNALDASGGACSTVGSQLNCSFAQLRSPGQTTVTIRLRGDGSLAQVRNISLLVTAGSAEDDHKGMVANLKQYTVNVNPDGDADNDGVLNGDDAFPGDPNESVDSDSDGIGNNADLDDDNDILPDTWERRFGFDPLNAGDAVADADGDQLSNAAEYLAGTRPDTIDTDRDQRRDDVDNCPLVGNANQYDQDSNGIGDACDRATFAAVAVLGDLDGNLALDYAIVRADGDRIEAFFKDSATDFSIGADRIDLGSTAERLVLDVAAAGPANGRDSVALVILYADASGAQRIQLVAVSDGTAEFDAEVFDDQWLYADAIVTTVSGQAEYWVVARNWIDDRVEVRRVDLTDGSVTAAHDFGTQLEPRSITADASGETMLLLAIDSVNGDLVATAREVITDARMGSSIVEGARALTGMVERNGAGFVVAVQTINGTIRLSVLDADGATIIDTFEVLDSGWTLLELATLTEWSGSGDAIVLAAVSNTGEMRLTIYDAANGSVADQQSFHASEFTARSFSASQQPGGGSSELSVLAAGADAVLALEARDAEGDAASRKMSAESSSPPPPIPPPPPPPPPSSSGGGGSAGLLWLVALIVALRRRRWLARRDRFTASGLTSTWHCFADRCRSVSL